MYFEQLDEVGGPRRLGRHVLHDPRSRAYDAEELARPRPLVTTIHACTVPPWDQGQIGSCTANAAFGCLVTEPHHGVYAEADARALYALETTIDDSQIPGRYPPDDTGSTGIWSMKALRRRGLIKGYRHAFRLTTVLHLLLDGPVSSGIPWYESMFDVDTDHTILCDFGGRVAGGHQICLVGIDVEREAVRVRNSWGTGWADGGYAWLKWTDYDELLHQQGDAVVPVL